MATNTIIFEEGEGTSGTMAAIITAGGGTNYDASQPVVIDCYSRGEGGSDGGAGGGFARKTLTPNPAHEFTLDPHDGDQAFLINSTTEEMVVRAYRAGYDGPGTPGYGETGDLLNTGGAGGENYSGNDRMRGGGGGGAGPNSDGSDGEDGTEFAGGAGGAGGGGLAGAGGTGATDGGAGATAGANYGGGGGKNTDANYGPAAISITYTLLAVGGVGAMMLTGVGK